MLARARDGRQGRQLPARLLASVLPGETNRGARERAGSSAIHEPRESALAQPAARGVQAALRAHVGGQAGHHLLGEVAGLGALAADFADEVRDLQRLTVLLALGGAAGLAV